MRLKPSYLKSFSPGLPDASTGSFKIPDMKALSTESLVPQGIYLIDNGHELIIWVGLDAHPLLLFQIFGVKAVQEIPFGAPESDWFNSQGSDVLTKVLNVS
jgi:protein transport protein SEC24